MTVFRALPYVIACSLTSIVVASYAAQTTRPDERPSSRPAGLPGQAGRLSDEERIDALIKTLEQLKDAIFIRNDKEYDAKSAADHLRMKWQYAGQRITTARHFITLVGTKSSVSGKPYLIRFEDGREMTSEAFLTAELEKLEAKPRTQPATQPATRPGATQPNAPRRAFDLEGSDAKAIELADAVMAKMGGRRAWNETRYIVWNFFGQRLHIWDKHSGRVRIELDGPEGVPYVSVLNIDAQIGRAWKGGQAVTDPDELARRMDQAEAMWINDSYWLVMPYKLQDAGVTLKYQGEREMEDGRIADVLQLTFQDVGRTPNNKYHIYVAKDSGLVEQFDYYEHSDDPTPRISRPWRDWKRFGRIMLSADRGERHGRPAKLTDIAVFDELPESVFTNPEPIDLSQWEPAAQDR
ncbi:MAG: DUF5329 family protein [Planctomycetota bacterium]|nr:DUF5329 family protein [Planctomycetota bacterium]